EVYVNGFSTSLPADVQEKALRTVPGLEKAHIIRLGYAVEYDFFPSYQLHPTLETRPVNNLYFAGQINGTSGYEEAAAQGLMAGINAALKLLDRPPLALDRSEAYIGVLIDDLINKTILEPYRMFTSRAEFRLLLRHDNADLRLMEKGYRVGLLPEPVYEKMLRRKEEIARLSEQIRSTSIVPESFNEYAERIGTAPIKISTPMQQLLKRPEVKLVDLLQLAGIPTEAYSSSTLTEVEFTTKYDGFLRRQQELVEKFKRMENALIPESIDYSQIPSLSAESREKLSQVRPRSIGQAARISGVRQSDLAILMVYVEKHNRTSRNVSRETLV
ncbi:MAG: tRNA uridine-5-carboxymethylaminomethyl(34) synthesis enzyme MnmG, partial [Calditrichaeota bacterium]